ncbi:hypothetical protein [Rhodococcus sp. AQ5-07]|uniref:hypothetical protein n=1 Tax=Rhodococcus sp. AQ5-07 TaxID=2054902 RepID=UPI000DBF3ECA|nr:hypothetical protein [Rhodococcus sp. AQ5-07]RAL31683.1 hypothetical protein CVN56_26305 [Rhodococcus sp. AQ5-07]
MVGLLGTAACGTPEARPSDDPGIARAGLLPDVSELPAGSQVERLDREDQMILNLNIHAPSDGIGLDMNPVFDPAQCEKESLYADDARAGLIENGSASGALLASGGT